MSRERREICRSRETTAGLGRKIKKKIKSKGKERELKGRKAEREKVHFVCFWSARFWHFAFRRGRELHVTVETRQMCEFGVGCLVTRRHSADCPHREIASEITSEKPSNGEESFPENHAQSPLQSPLLHSR